MRMKSITRLLAGRQSPRWAFLEGFSIGTAGDPYLDRLRIVQTPLASLYLHCIHRPDREPDPHDHPWWFASLVLSGGYSEIVLRDKQASREFIPRERNRFSVRAMPRRSAHLITATRGPVWTLVLTGPRRGDWGFWTGGGFTSWRDYISQEASDAGHPG